MSHDKPRLPRVERSDDYHVEDDTTHLWAVAYSDFLMVLLSFFILFFSIDSDEKDSLIREIVKATDTQTHAGGRSPDSTQSSTDVQAPAIEQINSQSLVDALKDFKIEVETDKKSIEFLFPDNIFSIGQFDLADDTKSQLLELLNRLKPFESQVEITIVGHTDSLPLKRNPTAILNDNYALSVVRATRAVQFAVANGMSPASVAAKGSADARRRSRTLSVVVRPNN